MVRSRLSVLIAAALICVSFTGVAALEQPLSYDIHLAIDYDQGSFDGRCVVNYTNTTGEQLSELFFRLFANDPSLYGTASIQVSSISIQTASVPLLLFVDDTVLLVPLDAPLQPEEQVTVEFAFAGQTAFWSDSGSTGIEQTGYGLLTKSSSALTLTAFYPILAVHTDEGWSLDPSTGFGDTLMGYSADYTVLVTTDSGPIPVTSGKLVATSKREDGQTEYAFTASGARDFALVLIAENYTSKTAELDHATIRAWFATQGFITAERTIDMAVHAFDLYEDIVGPSPFDDIDLVEVPLQRAAGVEFSGLILVSAEYARYPKQLFFSIIIAHEMAHQWFYAGVGNDVSEHPWLDESFATYLSYEFLESYLGTDVAQAELAQWSRTYDSHRNRTHLAISSPKYAFPDSSTYGAFVYSGGATFLHALRTTLGADTFYRALQSYYSEFLHRIATPPDLFRIVESICDCQFDELLSEFRIMP